MIDVDLDLLRELLADARLAPSVHNIQPSRWRILGNRLELLGDTTIAIPHADPESRDWRLSHGTHLEGFSIALRKRGLQLVDVQLHPYGMEPDVDGLLALAEMSIAASGEADIDVEPTESRVSWRGPFSKTDNEVRKAIAELNVSRDDCLIIDEQESISLIARLADRAALHFLRDAGHRAELLEWFRLQLTHPRYKLDGLNAESMNMSALEAWGAGLVLGPLFDGLDKLGLADLLLREAAKTESASALVLFHRELGEDPIVTGQAFYRSWLAMERVGLKGCPMSVLADWDVSRKKLTSDFELPDGRALVNVFRVGLPTHSRAVNRARLPVDDLVV